MVTDSIKNIDQYVSLHKDFAKVAEVLKTLTVDSPAGKIVIDEGNVWINIATSNGLDESVKNRFEAHKDFIDIHYIITGSENFGYGNISHLEITEPYNSENDVEFLKGDITPVIMKKGDFCIVYPQDAHIPAMKKTSSETLIRVVAKIRV